MGVRGVEVVWLLLGLLVKEDERLVDAGRERGSVFLKYFGFGGA